MGKSLVTTLCISVISIFLYTCANPEKPEERSGEIVMETATRGSYQYLIKIGKDLFWPENLPDQFKVPELKVRVRYKKKGTYKDIYKPAPNDVPVKDYTVPVITVLEIRKIP